MYLVFPQKILSFVIKTLLKKIYFSCDVFVNTIFLLVGQFQLFLMCLKTLRFPWKIITIGFISEGRIRNLLTVIVCFPPARKSFFVKASATSSDTVLFRSLSKSDWNKRNRANWEEVQRNYSRSAVSWRFNPHMAGGEKVRFVRYIIYICKPPTMPLPLHTTASIFLDTQSSALCSLSCLLWPPPCWLHSCRPATSRGSWDTSRSRTTRGRSLSLSTFILMQLPAFLRALTASWWVAPCMLMPLTWEGDGHITLWGAMKLGAWVRGVTYTHTHTHHKYWNSMSKGRYSLLNCGFLFLTAVIVSSVSLMMPSTGQKRNINGKYLSFISVCYLNSLTFHKLAHTALLHVLSQHCFLYNWL